jgi:TolA-binding protein
MCSTGMLKSVKQRVATCLLLLAFFAAGPLAGSSWGQESEAATRQFAVAVGFQNQKLYDSAIEEWQVFLSKFGKDPRVDKATHYLGTCQLQAKQYATAAATFASVMEKYPQFELLDQSILNCGTAWYSLAQETKKPEDHARAEAMFVRLGKDFPKSQFAARAMYYRGESQYQQNRLQEAADSYRELAKTFPQDELVPDSLYALGVCLESLKQPEDAQQAFADFEKRFPKHALLTEVRMRNGECLFAEQKFAEAAKQFELVSRAKEFPLADMAMLRQARCLYELEKYAVAGAIYWNVAKEFPKTKHYDTSVVAGAKCYYLIGQYFVARTGLENVAKRDVPEAAEASQWIARAFLKEKNAPQALTILDAAIVKHSSSPTLPQLILTRIDALYEMPERRAETAALYAEFAKKYPQEELASQASYMSALTALDLGDNAAAKQNADLFRQSFPQDKLLPDVLFIGAEARLLLKEFDAAVKMYEEFLKQSTDHPNANLAKIRAALGLQLAGRNDDAVKRLTPVLASLSDPALKSEALSILGRCELAKEQLAAAAERFEESLKAKPDHEQSDQTLLILADVYRRLDRPADSAARLKLLQTQFPKSKVMEEATFRLGEVAYAAGSFDDAIVQYSAVMKTWPQGMFAAHAQYGLSWCLFKKGDSAAAVEAVESLVKNFAGSEQARKGLYVRAMAEFQLQQYEAAEKDVLEYLKSSPAKKETLDAQYLQGLSLAGQQKFADAAKVYAEILKVDAKYADADKVLYELGWAHFELGQQPESIAAFQRLGQDYPESPLAVESLFRVGESLYETEKYADAAKAYQSTVAKAGDSELGEKAAHKLAWSYFKQDLLKEATDGFTKQLTQFPKGALAGDAEFLLAECDYRQKQWQAAIDHYAPVIAANHPVYAALAIFRSGECAAALEKWSDSLKYHQRVLKEYPDFELKAEARYGTGWALQQQDKVEEAIQAYEKVTEETDTETAAKARFMIGECFFAQKNHKEATKHFLKAAFAYRHPEWSAMALFEAARCFEVLKDIEQAKNCYQQLIEGYPQHAKVEDAKKRLREF